MTAYELANELSEFMTEDEYTELDKTIFKAVTMLRQQADRIAELEKEVEECWCGGHSYAYLKAKNRLPQTKPLSDEEIDSIIYSVDWAYDPVLLVRAIEERHGIK